MRILLVSPYFPPDVGSAANLFAELGRELARRGHEVSVAAPFPYYNVALPAEYRGKLVRTEHIDGMRVVRVRVPRVSRSSPILRGVHHLLLTAALWIAGRRAGRADVVIQYSPPLPVGLASLALGRASRAPVVLNIQDLFPQSAIDLGLLRSRAVIGAYRRLERFLYRASDAVTVHSAGNAGAVIAAGAERSRVHVVPNWVDAAAVRVTVQRDDARRSVGVGDGPLATFGGVVGYAQDVDVIVDAADALRATPWTFLIVGDGVEVPRLRERVRALGLASVRFVPMQPLNRYAAIVAASDVGLATLRADVRTPVVPSKIVSLMALGVPIAAALDPASDAAELVREAGCGVVVPAGDGRALAGALERLRADRSLRAALGERGRVRYLAAHTVAAAADAYERVVADACAARLLPHPLSAMSGR